MSRVALVFWVDEGSSDVERQQVSGLEVIICYKIANFITSHLIYVSRERCVKQVFKAIFCSGPCQRFLKEGLQGLRKTLMLSSPLKSSNSRTCHEFRFLSPCAVMEPALVVATAAVREAEAVQQRQRQRATP